MFNNDNMGHLSSPETGRPARADSAGMPALLLNRGRLRHHLLLNPPAPRKNWPLGFFQSPPVLCPACSLHKSGPVVKGHGFSRAVSSAIGMRALATAGRSLASQNSIWIYSTDFQDTTLAVSRSRRLMETGPLPGDLRHFFPQPFLA